MNIFDLEETKYRSKLELQLLEIKVDQAVIYNILKAHGLTTTEKIAKMRTDICNSEAVKSEFAKLKSDNDTAKFYESNPEERVKQAFKEKMKG